jgi:hypothetical protein
MTKKQEAIDKAEFFLNHAKKELDSARWKRVSGVSPISALRSITTAFRKAESARLYLKYVEQGYCDED